MERPIPHPTAETRKFWDGIARKVLLYQRCDACGNVQSYPRAWCAQCHATGLSWHESTGRAKVYSHTTVHRAATPAFRADVPYVIALLDVEEGFRVMANVRGEHVAALRIGAPFRIRCADRGDGVFLLHAESS